MSSNGVQNYGNLSAHLETASQIKDDPPPKGYTRVYLEITSDAPRGKDGKVVLPDADVERALFNKFGLRTETEADLQKIKERLKTDQNPFDYVQRPQRSAVQHRADGKYHLAFNVADGLYSKLAGRAAQIKKEIDAEKANKPSADPNESLAGKNGLNNARLDQAKLLRLIDEAQVQASNFGIPSKLTDLTHVVLTLPEMTYPNADNALSAYIQQQYGGSNLYGDAKLAILDAAKADGVKVENLKVSPLNPRVVEFDISLESRLKLRKAYLDVQEKTNADVAISEKARHDLAVNQFILGVIQGAKDDIAGNIHTLTHPIETLQGIRDAIGILSQLSAEDLQNIVSALGTKAANATPGEAAYGAGYVVGTLAVEIAIGKGTGTAINALAKTKAGAAFLAKLDKVGELGVLAKTKIAAAFSDEAAAAAKQKFSQRLRELNLSPNNLSNISFDPELWASISQIAGNKIKNGAVNFAEFSRQMVKEFGEAVRPHLENLYRDSLISLDLSDGKTILSANGKAVDEMVIREAKEKVADLVKNNKPVELKKYLEDINEKYGRELLTELNATREKFVDGIYDVNRRNIDVHDLLGGHIRDRHIGRSETWLRNRLSNDPELKNVSFASSFYNEAIANRSLGKFVNQHRNEIESWLKNSNTAKFEKIFEIDEPAGMVVQRGQSDVKESNKIYVMLTKDGSANGWHFVTAYPTASK